MCPPRGQNPGTPYDLSKKPRSTTLFKHSSELTGALCPATKLRYIAPCNHETAKYYKPARSHGAWMKYYLPPGATYLQFAGLVAPIFPAGPQVVQPLFPVLPQSRLGSIAEVQHS